MSAAIIISSPVDHRLDVPALQREFGRSIVRHDWHPHHPVTPGALHITPMHPGDLEDAGVDPSTIVLRGWPCPRDYSRAQRGSALPVIINWLAATLVALALGSTYMLDGPSDHSFELDQARDLETAQRTERARVAHERAINAACGGGNAAWINLPDGGYRCTTSGGRATGTIIAGVQP